jgi:two-component system, NarL family, sensor kinase
MKPHTAARLAWSIGALALAMSSATVALVISRPPQLPAGIESVEPLDLLGELPFLVFVGLGVLIAARRPKNPIGWMFTAIGSLVLFAGLASEYALYALHTNPGSLPAGAIMAWASTWSWVIGAGLVVFVILVFPNGHLATRRWRPLAGSSLPTSS